MAHNDDYTPRDYQDEVTANDNAEDRFTENATSDLHGVVGMPADKLDDDLDDEARKLKHPQNMEDDDLTEEVEDRDEGDND